MAEEAAAAAAAAAATAALAADVLSVPERPSPSSSTALSHSIDRLDGTMASGHSNTVTEGSTPTAGESTPSAAGKAPAVPETPAEFLSKDNQAFTIITLNIRDTQISHIQRCSTSKQAWDALREVHQGIDANGRMVLTQRLWDLHLREGDDMASHLNSFREIVNQIETSLGTMGRHKSRRLTFDFMTGRLLQESTCRQASIATGGSPRAMRFGSRGRSSFGVVDPARFGNAGADRGPPRRTTGKCH